MLFNSIEFAIFLPIVFVLYWFVFNSNLKVQNGFLLVASYVFYGWWDWRFLFLIAVSSLIDYTVGVKIHFAESERFRKILLATSIVANVIILLSFKYSGFFVESFSRVFTLFGKPFMPERLNLVLPVGISFYTLQTMSYSIDVYRRKLEPTKDIVAFFSFVSFFPQLVAGPIERAVNLLPQIRKTRQFSYELGADGMRQILWGLFKKIVVADNCAVYVNEVFRSYEQYNGSTLFIGAVLYSIQIYADFSGYSDIAIGTAKLFGFRLSQNFNKPYLAKDIIDFWRRWHMSFSVWLREYIYIPLGGNREGIKRTIINVFIVFFVSSLWHGIEPNFLVWGLVNASVFSLTLSLSKQLKCGYEHLVIRVFSIFATFVMVSLIRVIYRIETPADVLYFLQQFYNPNMRSSYSVIPFEALAFALVMFAIEIINKEAEHGFEKNGLLSHTVIRRLGYAAVLYLIVLQDYASQVFIYYQF